MGAVRNGPFFLALFSLFFSGYAPNLQELIWFAWIFQFKFKLKTTVPRRFASLKGFFPSPHWKQITGLFGNGPCLLKNAAPMLKKFCRWISSFFTMGKGIKFLFFFYHKWSDHQDERLGFPSPAKFSGEKIWGWWVEPNKNRPPFCFFPFGLSGRGHFNKKWEVPPPEYPPSKERLKTFPNRGFTDFIKFANLTSKMF